MAKLRLDKQAPKVGAKAAVPLPDFEVSERAGARVGYLFQCAPGLASVLQKELLFIGAKSKPFVKLQRNHDLVFLNHVENAERLSELRCAEMALKCPAYGRFKISQRQLGLIVIELQKLGPRRLVVNVAGNVFQRQDLARFFTKAMSERGYDFNDSVEDEVWMFCIDENWYFGLPLFKARMLAHRNERTLEREGSLPPTVAAAMCFASHPERDDVVFDPTCGSGTLLAEFHACVPSARLIGRDIDENAVAIAKRNLAHVGGTDIQRADSRHLTGGLGAGLEAADDLRRVTVTLANLPFGLQFGDKASNAALYEEIFRAGLPFQDPQKWRGLYLTSDTESLAKGVRQIPEFTAPQVMFKVSIRGELATCVRVRTHS